MTTSIDEQLEIPCTLMRGGTSKGVYFLTENLPSAGPERDAILKAVMGSEDNLQIDALGGSRLVTAKLAIVGKSAREGIDVDYTYGIVPPGRNMVVYTSNCGNISAGVGPFAIDSGLVNATEPVTKVRIFNTNTKKLIVAHVPVVNGKARVSGACAIPGVPGTGAEIFLDYSGTTGAKTGKVLPSGNAVDQIELESGQTIDVTFGDVANPCVFIRAADLDRSGSELPNAINEDHELLQSLAEIRAKAALQMGLCSDWKQADAVTPALPLVMLVAPAANYVDSEERVVDASAVDLRARMVFYGKCHESMAGTGSMCLAAMSRIPGTLVHEAAYGSETWRSDTLRIGHPLGAMTVNVERSPAASEKLEPGFERLGLVRTARRLMHGVAYVPRHKLPV